jgi:hypothetical protein
MFVLELPVQKFGDILFVLCVEVRGSQCCVIFLMLHSTDVGGQWFSPITLVEEVKIFNMNVDRCQIAMKTVNTSILSCLC